MEDNNNKSQVQIELFLDASPVSSVDGKKRLIPPPSLSSILTKIHAGYFRISLSLCGQALLWKTLVEPTSHTNALQRFIHMVPSAATSFLWSLALLALLLLSLLYLLRCFFNFKMVKAEFLHHIGVNYLFAPWISWLLLLQSSPFIGPGTVSYLVLWWVFVLPVIVLDVKIYGQWFTKGKRFLSRVANPTSLLSVMGNLAGAQAAAHMGWRESAVCMFTLGMAHYLVLFVTLYQRLSATNSLPVMLRPVFFLFFAAPSIASLAWDSISGNFDTFSKMLFFLSLFLFTSLRLSMTDSLLVMLRLVFFLFFVAPSMASLAWDSVSGNFDTSSKMLFFLSLFLFTSLVTRPALFKKAMKKFNVAWWAYSFPLTMLALAATQYAQEVECGIAQGVMYGLLGLSVLVSLALIVSTALNTSLLLPNRDPIPNPPPS